MDRPLSTIAAHLRHLELEELFNTYSWAHIAIRILHRRLPSLQSLQQTYVVAPDSAPASSTAPHLLSSSDARFSFSAQFRGVRKLALRNYKFQNLRVLARIIASFPALSDLFCTNLCWCKVRQTHHQFSKLNSPVCRIHITQCEDLWSLLWLFTTSSQRPNALTTFVHAADIETLACLVATLIPDVAAITLVLGRNRGKYSKLESSGSLWYSPQHFQTRYPLSQLRLRELRFRFGQQYLPFNS